VNHIMAEDNLSENARQQARDAVQGITAEVSAEQSVGPAIEDIPDWRDIEAMSAHQQAQRDQALADRDAALIAEMYEVEDQDQNTIDDMSEEEMEKALEAAYMLKDAVEAESLTGTDISEAEITGYEGVTPSLTPELDTAEPTAPADPDMDK